MTATPDNQAADQCLRPLIVGIDWSDSKHDITILDDGRSQHLQVDANPRDMEEMILRLTKIADGREIAVCLEKGRIRILYQLLQHKQFILYPVDPKQAARYRQSFASSKAKDDRTDSRYLARLLHERMDDMKPLKQDDPLTRKIASLTERRRGFVNEKTRFLQQLTAEIKVYHPLALMLPGSLDSPMVQEFVRRFPDPRKAKKAHRLTLTKLFQRHGCKKQERIDELIQLVRNTPIVTTDAAVIDPAVIVVQALLKQMNTVEKAIAQCDQEILVAMSKHPDAPLFQNLPGAGAALAPRLLALYGSDRDRHENASEVAAMAGIAPVTIQSGKTCVVTRRYACPKFLLQTFHEFARCASIHCPWSRAYYLWQRSIGVGQHAAIRKLATRWNRIIFAMWKTKTPYDPKRYLNTMISQDHPLVAFLTQEQSSPNP
jgi:transposase